MPFEALRENLLRAGVAPRHVRRYMRELDDHLADLIEAQQAAGHDAPEADSRARALLGGDAELAAAMLARPELKSWAARAPWLVFGLLPPLTIMAGFFVLALPLALTARFGGWMRHDGMAAPDWFRIWAGGTAGLADLALGPALTCGLLLMAERQRMTWKWPVLASVILALADFRMATRFSPPGQRGLIAITALGEFSGPPFPMEGPLWGLTFLLTLAPLLWLLRGRRLFAREEKPN
jgi:hypothetical protein